MNAMPAVTRPYGSGIRPRHDGAAYSGRQRQSRRGRGHEGTPSAALRRIPLPRPSELRQSPEVKYCFEDEDVAHVAENMAELQVRRLPVMNRDKLLVGIVSLADLAIEGSLPKTAKALHGISQPGGQHNQSRS